MRCTPAATPQTRILIPAPELSQNHGHIPVRPQSLESFTIQVSGMDYGFVIGGILGMDFLRRSGAVIDLRQLQIEFAV